jgi:hypothetical protein
MAFIPSGIWLTYARGMGKFGDIKERNRGITLAIGFLLMALGECILVPYFRVPLIPSLGICFAGILTIYLSFVEL